MTDTPSCIAPKIVSEITPKNFSDFGLDATLLEALTTQGYTQATPIQTQAIPVFLQGQDVMGIAQTGTGKTAGFALPILQRLLPFSNTSTSPAKHPIRALVLAPTRELAVQVYNNIATYAQNTTLRCTVVFGGVDIGPQTTLLRNGVEILVATPGRLLDHLQQGTLQLGQTQMLVLDEADRMLDMGFLPDLQRILNFLPKARQTALFSATFSKDIRKLAESFLNTPQIIEVMQTNSAAALVNQRMYEVASERDKYPALKQLLQIYPAKPVIIFINSKIGANNLARQLKQDHFSSAAIHSDRSQIERMQILEDFKQGLIDMLVATDIAARGLDIAELPMVINYELPSRSEDYVHRIGRTGRAGMEGDAISLYSPDEEDLLKEIEKLTKRSIPRESLGNFQSNASSPRKPSSSYAQRSPAIAHAPVDDFFYKPYEPASTENNSLEPQQNTLKDIGETVSSLPKKGHKKPLAALLQKSITR